MINSLHGFIKEISPKSISIAISGIEFNVAVPNENVFFLNQEITIHIHFHWNQELGPQLYGFNTNLEKQIFTLLISCSGLGPKIALTILSQLSAENIIEAIMISDTNTLSSITGVSQKKAELIIMQLKDKIPKIASNNKKLTEENSFIANIGELTQALNSLGYSRKEVNIALSHIKKLDIKEMQFNELLKKSLLFLSKR